MPFEAWLILIYVLFDLLAIGWTWITEDRIQVTTAAMWAALITHVVLIICVISLAERIS